MNMSFNLIITYEPGRENLDWVFSQINECIGTSYVVTKVKPSMILLNVENPYEVWKRLKQCLYNRNTAIYRVIPVDEVVDPIVERVAKKASEYALSRIPQDATYRITLHGKLYTLDANGRLVRSHTLDAIRLIAEGIPRKVDLENPQWVVYIRTVPVGRWFIVAALSVAKAVVFKNIRVGPPQEPL